MSGVKAKPLFQRFWARVVKTGTPVLDGKGPCWLFGGNSFGNKYGVMSRGPGLGNVTAHRYSFELHKGPLTRGKYACHECDRKNCVNPRHLYEGDHEDNNEDSRVRGLFVGAKVRSARIKTRPGEARFNRKLGLDDVKRLRAEYAAGSFTQMQLAKRYGVSQGTVSATIRGVKNMGAGGDGKRRTGNFRRKLSVESIEQIRRLYAQGDHTQQQLAEQFGCHQTYVSMLVR